MILGIIDTIRGLVNRINPDILFECDAPEMMNIKADTISRDIPAGFVYVEEPTSGYYEIPYRGYQKQRVSLRVYFCDFEPMANDAYKGDSNFSWNSRTEARLSIRERIEETMVRPFLYLLKNSDTGMRYPGILSSVRVTYPVPQFDANEVSVCLELTFEDSWCLDNYKPIQR
jgi:hypothetical protein|nr:MAG TPA: hypothetical protein [Caudoviricetes sp.]